MRRRRRRRRYLLRARLLFQAERARPVVEPSFFRYASVQRTTRDRQSNNQPLRNYKDEEDIEEDEDEEEDEIEGYESDQASDDDLDHGGHKSKKARKWLKSYFLTYFYISLVSFIRQNRYSNNLCFGMDGLFTNNKVIIIQ